MKRKIIILNYFLIGFGSYLHVLRHGKRYETKEKMELRLAILWRVWI
jgi:hypothetical protein